MVKQNKNFLLLMVLVAVASLGVALLLNDHAKKPVKLKEVTAFKAPRKIKSFHLTGTNGKVFNQKSLRHHYTLMFFGFTRCPMMCPTTMAMLNQVYKKLEKKGVKSMPRVVFVSVDPDRDTIQVVKRYVKSFNTHFIGAVGSKQAVSQLMHQFNVMAAKIHQGKGYTIEHSNTVLIINPQGRFYGVFSNPQNVNDVVNDLEVILR